MQTAVKFTGATPGTDSTERTLFDTTVASPFAARFFALSGTKRFDLDIAHSHSGTLTTYWSADRGTTWNKNDVEVVGVPAANTTDKRDYHVEPYDDWKVTWTNGGTAQSPWIVQMSLSESRTPSA